MSIVYSLLPAQREFIHVPAPRPEIDVCVYQGGFGCLDGCSRLALANGLTVPIKSFKGGYVLSWDGQNIVAAYATAAKSYEPKPLYQVTLSNGPQITCTNEHQFLTPLGWKPLCSLSPLDVLLCADSPLQSDLESYPSARALSAAHFQQTVLNYPDDYLIFGRQCDEPLLCFQDSGQASFPSRVGVLSHSRPHWQKDDSAHELNDSRLYQSSVHHSKTHFAPHSERQISSQVVYYVDDNTSESLSLTCQQLSQFLSNLTPVQLTRLSGQPYTNLSDISYNKPLNQNLLESVIKSIEPVKIDYYYDLHVPGLNNYLAEGFINHNSGKTFIGSFLGDRLSQKYPKNRGLVVAKTYPLVRDTTLVSYFEHFNNYGYEAGRDYTWKASESKIIYPNGSEILFRHLEDPNKIKSLNLGWVHIEEMSEIDEAGFLMCLSRLRLPHIPTKRLFGTTNPQATKGYIHRIFVSENKSNEKTAYRRVIASSTENIGHLGAAYLDNMRDQYSEAYYRVNVLGQDGDYRDGLVVPGWSIANEDESLVYNPDFRLYLTCDFNVDPMCWEIAHRVQLPNGLTEYQFVDELAIENTNIIQTAEEFARRYWAHTAGIIVTGDATGRNRSDSSANPNESKYKILMNTLSNCGLKNIHLDVPTSNPHEDIRVEAWNGLVCNVDGVRRIKANPNKCPKLIYNMNNLKYIPGTSIILEPSIRNLENDVSKTLKFTKHPFDAASYLTYRYDPIRRDPKHNKGPIFTTVGFTPGR